MGNQCRCRLTIYLSVQFFVAISCSDKPAAPPTPPPPETSVVAADIIHFNSLSGDQPKPAERLPKGAATWVPVTNAAVNSGDQLHAPADTTGMIQLRCGVRVALNSDATILLNACDDITLAKGEIWIARPLSEEKRKLTLRTSAAEVVFDGAVGSARFDGAALNLSLVSGKAVVAGQADKLAVAAGEGAAASAEGLRKVHIKDPEGIVAWTQGLRHAIALSTSVDPIRPLPTPIGLGTLKAHLPGAKAPLPFEIMRQDVTVGIQDHMALTRVEQVFRNPTANVVEGEYKFPLPDGARLTGYDMEVNGRLMRGEIVEKQKGRAIMKKVVADYLDSMRPKDPALVEWESGNTFKTRIFPIKAREQKRVVISYLQPLRGESGRYRYQLPLAVRSQSALPIPSFRVSATIGSTAGKPSVWTPLYPAAVTDADDRVSVSYEATAFVPMADFVIEIDTPEAPEAALATYAPAAATAAALPILPTPAWGTAITVGDDGYFMLQLTPELPPSSRESRQSDWMLLVDTSESRFGPDSTIERLLASALLDIMGPDDRVKLIRFDTFAEVMDPAWLTPDETLKPRVAAFLGDTPGGATNIEGALREAAKQVDPGRPLNIVLITDGAATVGERAPGAMAALSKRLFAAPEITLSTVAVGASVDTLLLETLAKSVRGKTFGISGGEDLFGAAVRIVTGLRNAPLSAPSLSFEGAAVSRVLPETLPNIVPGESLIVTGRHRGQGPLAVTLEGALAGRPWQKTYTFTLGAPKSANTFIPLFHAANQLDALMLDDSDAAEREAVALSKRYGIATRYTSFIVLENEAMYRRFKVDQSGDRPTWEGTEAIDYEIPETDDEEIPEALGDGEALQIAGGASGSAGSGAGISSARASGPPKMAKARSAKRAAESPAMSRSIADFDAPLYSRPPMPRPKPTFAVNIWRPSTTPSSADTAKATALSNAVAAAPLSRKRRRDLVRHLTRTLMLPEAKAAVAAWLDMDRSNPEPYLLAAEIDKLLGDMKSAFRHFGSAVELKPDSKGILKTMAGYFESRGVWDRAAPFRAALAYLEPKPGNETARRAVVTAMMGDPQSARAMVATLVAQKPTGYHQIKNGRRLTKGLAAAVKSLADLGTLPADFNPFRGRGTGGKIVITLETGPSAGVELWVKKDSDKFYGGMDDSGYVTGDPANPSRISVVSPSGDTGIYRVQILCSNPNGCAGVSGKLHLKAFDRRRTLPFTLTESRGQNLAVLKVKRQIYRY